VQQQSIIHAAIGNSATEGLFVTHLLYALPLLTVVLFFPLFPLALSAADKTFCAAKSIDSRGAENGDPCNYFGFSAIF